jgi:hypothetical protein
VDEEATIEEKGIKHDKEREDKAVSSSISSTTAKSMTGSFSVYDNLGGICALLVMNDQ